MLHRLTKIYEGDLVTRVTSGLLFVPIDMDGDIVEVSIESLHSLGTAIYTARLNGSVLWTGGDRISIAGGGSGVGTKSGLSIAVEENDDFHVDLVETPTSNVPAPIVVTVTIDDGIEYQAQLAPETVADETARFALTDKVMGDIIRQTDTSETYVVIDPDELDNAAGYTLIAEPGGGGGVSDGDKGDITVSSSGTVWTIDSDAVTETKIANDAVTTNKIDDDAVTAAKLADVVNPLGKQTIYIPASAMIPATTNGPAAAQLESTTNKQNYSVLDFDASTDEFAHFQVAFPKGWDEETVSFQAFWSSTATDTDGVAWALEGVARSDNEAIDNAWGTAVVVTDDAQSAAGELYVSAESGAVTIGGSPAADDLCFFRISRDVSDANDDMTEDARLIGIKLFYTINAANDA